MITEVEDKELRAFINKQFDGIGLDDETKEVFIDLLHAYTKHQADALNYTVSNCWPERDSLPTGDPIGDVSETLHKKLSTPKGESTIGVDYGESYYTVIRQAGAHIDHSMGCILHNQDKCCINTTNHKKVPIFTSIITVCSVCDSKIEI